MIVRIANEAIGFAWNRCVTGPALYDVVSDPDERHDLIGDPEMGQIAGDLTIRLDRWRSLR